MDLFALILSCALSANSVVLTMTHQIASSVDGDPLHIEDLTSALVYSPQTHDEAAKIVSALLEAGHDLRVGLTQLRARRAWLEYGLTPGAMLNSCTNISVGSDLLARELASAPPRAALASYLIGSSSDPVGLYWADQILLQDTVDLGDAAFEDVETPRPSRLYEEPSKPLFVLRAKPERAAPVVPRRRKSERLFVVESTNSEDSPTPQKWEPITKPASTASRATVPTGSSETKRPTSKSANSRRRAQPDVTNEKLPTTEELRAGDVP